MTFERYMELDKKDFEEATASIVASYFEKQEGQAEGLQINDKICRKAIDTFGTEMMLNVCMEEPAELLQAISKMRRLSTGDISSPIEIERKCNLVEEIADVNIILTELMMIYDVKPHEVQTWIESKQTRTESRIQRAEREKRK